MSALMHRYLAFVGINLLVLSACGGGTKGSGFDDNTNPQTGADSGAGPSNSGGPTGALGGGSSDAGSGTAVTLFYAHTNNTLYSMDPTNIAAAPVSVGTFDCIGGGGSNASSMTDIAVAKDGSLYGVSQKAAYPLSISGTTVHCNATWPLPSAHANFYGLTVAPENTVSTQEVLIAADDGGNLFQIDATTGNTTQVGTLGVDTTSSLAWGLSGDIVFVANAGSPLGFATVRTCNSHGTCQTTDTLIQIDVSQVKPGTQSVLKAVSGPVNKGSWCTNPTSPTSFGSMYGIVAYQDKVYGFSHSGDVVEIHNTDGSGCLVNSYASMEFAGAGVTTVVPVIAPR
jgi:hypothetical protein